MRERMRAIAVAVLMLGMSGIAAAEANRPILDSAERQQPNAMKLSGWSTSIPVPETWTASMRSVPLRSRS